MNRENIQKTLETAKLMATGAVILILAAIVFWSAANFDVLIKAVKYPEAIRQMKIEVRVAQTATK
jgi:hypothetical protein